MSHRMFKREPRYKNSMEFSTLPFRADEPIEFFLSRKAIFDESLKLSVELIELRKKSLFPF